MIKITFAPPDTESWKTWVQECSDAQTLHDQQVIAGGKAEADSKLYGRMKKEIFLDASGPFHGKCAFCEEKIRTNQHGDIEHFRPKGAIVDAASRKPIKKAGGDAAHPGYYWLAYDWQNFLPACVLCNQPNTEPTGESIGKRNYFPLADETQRAQAKGGEAGEQPLLINPLVDDPAEHLGVDQLGVMFANNDSPRGKTCIEIFGLNLRDLPAERLRVYDDTKTFFKNLIDLRFSQAPGLAAAEARYRQILGGAERFTAVARLAIDHARRDLLAALEAKI